MMKLNFYKVYLSLQEEVGSDNYLFLHNSQEEREQVHVTKAVHMSENENRKEMTF